MSTQMNDTIRARAGKTAQAGDQDQEQPTARDLVQQMQDTLDQLTALLDEQQKQQEQQ